ncbi:hypothetical protein CHUAL_009707 [Chamberlinius hualienensis]
MYPVLSAVIANIKGGGTIIDNPVFCLHYKCTCWILIAFSIVVTSNQFFGDPINCFNSLEMPEKRFDKIVGIDVVEPGIDKRLPEDQVIYHAYYQWVCFYLILQGCMFYIPRAIWRLKEGGNISKIVLGLNAPIIGSDEDIPCNDIQFNDSESFLKTKHPYGVKNKRVITLAQYLYDSMGYHRCYAYTYFLCEVLNLVNVIGQIFLTNIFLGGEFTTYGLEVIKLSNTDQYNRTDSMIKIFPRVTKCIFHRFGLSGSIEKHDILCVLPVNVINEKIFIFLWFWFLILALLSAFQVVYRVFIVLIPSLRWYLLTQGCSSKIRSLIDEIEKEHRA